MFDHAHYVPLLRWKRGERGALKWLEQTDKASMTPLLELLPGYLRPRRAKGSQAGADDLSVAVDQIADSWGTLPIFIDVGRVRSVPYGGAIRRNVERFFTGLATAGVRAIPVTCPGQQTTEFQQAIREAAQFVGYGVAIRVPMRYVLTGMESELPELIRSLGPELESVVWHYTIQHPTYREPIEGANPSASIRYTSDGYWVIMRGEGLRNPGGAGHAQYPANAELLCLRKEFCGPSFSAGDRYIYRIASHEENGPGTPETWLRAGINHHLVFTTRQISTAITAAP